MCNIDPCCGPWPCGHPSNSQEFIAGDRTLRLVKASSVNGASDQDLDQSDSFIITGIIFDPIKSQDEATAKLR